MRLFHKTVDQKNKQYRIVPVSEQTAALSDFLRSYNEFFAADGDEEYVSRCEVVFTYKGTDKKDVIVMFQTTGVSRESTIYKESVTTYRQIAELAEALR